MKRCPHCRQPMPAPSGVHSSVPDEAILRALEGGEWRKVRGVRRFFPPNLYVSAHRDNSREADWSRWYVTGPDTRPNYVRGPFPLEQVQRLVESGRLRVAHADASGNVHVWELRQ